jgi:ribosomal protein S18 acetylase RimI-like enzyme
LRVVQAEQFMIRSERRQSSGFRRGKTRSRLAGALQHPESGVLTGESKSCVSRNVHERQVPPVIQARFELLDNPIWSALTTDHAHLALGADEARRYPAEIGPLSGMPVQSDAGYAALAEVAPPCDVAVLFLDEAPRPPAGWELVRGGAIVQMVAEQPKLAETAEPAGAELRRLTAEDAPAMVELARLTEPGPFRLRTMELGNFFGICGAGRLVAMAGERLHVPGCVEVSGVCTHPEVRGRGYARLLMSQVMEGIVAAGKTPFLHAWADNYSAIRVYESLGFTLRRQFEVAAIRREG